MDYSQAITDAVNDATGHHSWPESNSVAAGWSAGDDTTTDSCSQSADCAQHTGTGRCHAGYAGEDQ
jgi:uncharacterized protein YbdZ (MbtH family)